jgi:hypothetical protein
LLLFPDLIGFLRDRIREAPQKEPTISEALGEPEQEPSPALAGDRDNLLLEEEKSVTTPITGRESKSAQLPDSISLPTEKGPLLFISVRSGEIKHGCNNGSRNSPVYWDNGAWHVHRIPDRQPKFCMDCGGELPYLGDLKNYVIDSPLPITEEWHRIVRKNK